MRSRGLPSSCPSPSLYRPDHGTWRTSLCRFRLRLVPQPRWSRLRSVRQPAELPGPVVQRSVSRFPPEEKFLAQYHGGEGCRLTDLAALESTFPIWIVLSSHIFVGSRLQLGSHARRCRPMAEVTSPCDSGHPHFFAHIVMVVTQSDGMPTRKRALASGSRESEAHSGSLPKWCNSVVPLRTARIHVTPITSP